MLEEQISANNVLQLIEKVGGNYLVDLNLFDVYRGNGIESGFKSLAIAMILQDNDKTLRRKGYHEVVDRVVDTLKAELNASLRD